MSPRRLALTGAAVFDGTRRREGGVAVLIEGDTVLDVLREAELPAGTARLALEGGLLAPGLVDLQVNGGAGVLLNGTPTADGVRAICAAHARFGTTALLPTVITDAPPVTAAAIRAAREAVAAGVPGCLGLHVEGPFIAPARKGAHDAGHVREMAPADADALARTGLPHLVVTLAPERVPDALIRRLAEAGVVVSLGHSDATYARAAEAAAAGARAVTHLFNAMSPLAHREPGLVGAALDLEALAPGLIADGQHVHPAAVALAARAKRPADGLFLVSDAMPTAAGGPDGFALGGRVARRGAGGRLELADGTLAGADMTLLETVRLAVRAAGIGLEEALAMASLRPARLVGAARHGRIARGSRADLLHLSAGLELLAVWQGGAPVAPG